MMLPKLLPGHIRCFILYLLILIILFFQSCRKDFNVDIITPTQFTVWNEAPHNAFTDLIKFTDFYYCVFREGSSHNSYDGKLRVVRSIDGITWNKFSLLSLQNKDLRDPHFFIDDNNILAIGTNATDKNGAFENKVYKLQLDSFVLSKRMQVDNDYWLWSFSKFNGKLYSMGYNIRQTCFNNFVNSTKSKIMLFHNEDSACTSFSNVLPGNLSVSNFHCPNESTMTFTGDSSLITVLRDENGEGSHVGISKFPFFNWEWKSFPYYVRGPKVALLPNGKLFLCAGSMINYNKTYYEIIDPKTLAVEKVRAFVSGGDTGYPGVIIEGNTALVSYYSSHEGNSRVYIERIVY
jgi:hypothetical protein